MVAESVQNVSSILRRVHTEGVSSVSGHGTLKEGTMTDWSAVLYWWVAFAGTHLVLSALPVRRPLIGRLGERGFQGLYSLIALATFIPLVRAYWIHRHSGPLLWSLRQVPGIRLLAILLATAGLVLVVVSFFQPSPTGMTPGAGPRAHGITRITRHPFFSGVGLWGLGHCLVNGALVDVLFFGGFAVFGLIGAAHQDARKRATEADRLGAFYAETSLLPFKAIVAGQTRLRLAEIPWLGVVVGVALAAILYGLHPWLFSR